MKTVTITRGFAIVAALVTVLLMATPARACTIPRTLGVAFSIDDSASMSSSDPDLLRAAATGAGIDQLADGSWVSVSSFDSSSRSLVAPLVVSAGNRQEIKADAEGGLYPSGQTYYDLAFTRAKGQLDAMSGADKRALIFLSDGAPNGGDYTYQLGLIKRAGIPVFAIGFASAPGSVLANIAAETGGQAFTIQSPGEAQAVFARIISTLTCDAAQVRADVTLRPNETRSFPYTIGPSDREFRALATWSYGGVNVRLVRPDQSALAPGTERAGERFISEDTYASITGTNPQVGGWALEITASADNADDVDVSIDVFRRTSADPPDAFPLTAPATGARLPNGAATFQWAGARNAESYELEIDDRVVQTAITRDASSVTVGTLAAGQHSWRVAAVNQFGRTLSERRLFTAVAGYKYVALGDSYSSGEGVPPSYFEPANRCHRSTQAYPVHVQQPGVGDASLYELRAQAGLGVAWGFQACSGAVTENLLDKRQGKERFVQLAPDTTADAGNANRLPVDANTNLVTLTIGGNNMKFAEVLTWCGQKSASCDTDDYKDTGKSLAAYQRQLRDAVAPDLTKVYERIRRQAPNARIMVLGYPQMFPKTAREQNCVKIIQRKLPKLGIVGFSHAEQNALRQATSEFNQTIAARAQAAGAEFVPVDGYFAGHEICGSEDDDWMNSPTFQHKDGGGWKDWGATDQTFHPNEKGHKSGYATAINDALNPGPVPVLMFANVASAPVRAGASGGVSLGAQKVSCPSGGPGCTVIINAKASVTTVASAAARRTLTIGVGSFSLRPGKSRPIAFKLGAAGRRALAKAKRLRATVTVVAYRGGRSTTQTATVDLRAPKRRG
jgi:hypothetical protein